MPDDFKALEAELARQPTATERIWHAGHLERDRFHKDRSYYGIRAAALGPDPALANPQPLFGRINADGDEFSYSEIDQWLYQPLSWQCYALLMPREDFSRARDDHKRLFLLVCGEALYGDHCDDEILEFVDKELAQPV